MNRKDQNIETNEFDQNLLLALLVREDLFNEQNNETMAQHILNSNEYAVTDNTAVLHRLQADFGNKKFYLNAFIIGLLLAGAIALGIWKFSGEESQVITNRATPSSELTNEPNVISMHTSEDRSAKQHDPEMVMPLINDSLTEEVPDVIVVAEKLGPTNATRMHIPEPYIEDDADVPGLTAAQIRSNNKRKLEMLRDIAKKKSFFAVLSGPAWRNGARYELSQFYLQGSEVSNWQYTVFLNDLIADGRTADYLAAKPVKGNWRAIGLPEFEETYADDEGFEKFPVVNITRAGAEMYCTWLTAEMSEAISNRDVKWSEQSNPQFRLPSDIEWLRAARGNDSTLQFPWGAKYNALQNARGCYLCNFNYSLSKDVLSKEGPEGSKGCVSSKTNTRKIITTAGRSIDTLVLAPEYSYNGGVFGHYLLLGNAAEMVWTYDATQPASKGVARAMGGSWYSHADEVRIESKQQFDGVTEANAQIGFRCVMSF